jgi:hypothetical protein
LAFSFQGENAGNSIRRFVLVAGFSGAMLPVRKR